MTRVYFSMAIEASMAYVLSDKFEGHQLWIIFDCLFSSSSSFFLTSTYVESHFTSWKFPTLAICLIIYNTLWSENWLFNAPLDVTLKIQLLDCFLHTPEMTKKKVEVCLSRKTYSHHHNKCSWKESYARFFISLNLLSCVKLSFLLYPFQLICSSYSLS